MTFTDYTNVRLLTGYTTTDIVDADITSLIAFSTAQLNADIQTKIVREEALYIDKTRTNYRDGSNTTFYVKNWKEFYLGDGNNDGVVSATSPITDVSVVLLATDGTETAATVSTLTHDQGKITLSAAPASGVRVFITYFISPVDMSTPHNMIKLACSQLTGAIVATKLDTNKMQSWSVGKIRVTKPSQAFVEFYAKYKQTLEMIKRFPLRSAETEKVTTVGTLVE